ncbi:hypothetical protein ABZ865_30285 [Streptomyces sp. NPDC047085]|uniref:hypothetical protein n=1 Tax=Streptomyces sp. NPDC047085 TaxID=3155140 RepID=UPI0033E2EA76
MSTSASSTPSATPAPTPAPTSGGATTRMIAVLAHDRAPLVAALATAATTLLLLQLGSGHTPSSRRFAALPEFDVWIWVYAAEAGAAAALGIAALPAFLRLANAMGRSVTVRVVTMWPALGILMVFFGPRALDEHNPLWLGFARYTTINAATWAFITPCFAGLLLVHTRVAALTRETTTAVAQGTAGALVEELLWLRTAMQRFLTAFAAAITGGMLALGALRSAMLANGTPAGQLPVLRLLTYGGVFTATSALLFVPAYVAWQSSVSAMRDALHPVPVDGRPPHDWVEARADFDTLLDARSTAGRVLTAVFSVLAPLVGTVVTALFAAR